MIIQSFPLQMNKKLSLHILNSEVTLFTVKYLLFLNEENKDLFELMLNENKSYDSVLTKLYNQIIFLLSYDSNVFNDDDSTCNQTKF